MTKEHTHSAIPQNYMRMISKIKKVLRQPLWAGLAGVMCASVSNACTEKKMAPLPVIPASEYLTFELASANHLNITEAATGHYSLETTGGDPYVHLSPLKQANGDGEWVLTFEYQSTAPVSHLQVFLAAPVSEDRSVKTGALDASAAWRTFSVDLGDQISEYAWGRAGQFLRLDFGDATGVAFEIRHIRLRQRNAQEEQLALEREAFRLNDQQWD